MSETVASRIVAVLSETAGLSPDEPINDQTQLLGGGLGLDSVVVLELLMALENEFDIEMDPQELIEHKALSTVGSLVVFVAAKVNQN